MFKKLLLVVASLTLTLTFASCDKDSGNTNGANTGNRNAGAANTAAQNVIPGPDNSEIRTETINGAETATRVFNDPNSPVERVVVTRRDGRRTARIHLRSGEVREVTTEGDIERALNAAGNTLVAVGTEVGDKAEDIGGAAADVGREIGDKAEDAAGQTVKGAKAVGSEVGDKAEDVGDKTVSGAKKAGRATKKGVKKAADKIEDVIP